MNNTTPQITKDPPSLKLTPQQEEVIQKFFLDEGYPCHVTPWGVEGEVFVEIAPGHPEHEADNGHFLTADGHYVIPGFMGPPVKVRPENM